VRRGVGKIEEEWLCLRLAHEFNRSFGDQRLEVGLG
jgi:hypothetical protein